MLYTQPDFIFIIYYYLFIICVMFKTWHIIYNSHFYKISTQSYRCLLSCLQLYRLVYNKAKLVVKQSMLNLEPELLVSRR